MSSPELAVLIQFYEFKFCIWKKRWL